MYPMRRATTFVLTTSQRESKAPSCISPSSANILNSQRISENFLVQDMPEPHSAHPDSIVCLDYAELLEDSVDLSAEIRRAYGAGGLGILFVKNVPLLAEKRQALLPLSRQLATLPRGILEKYENDPPVVGWSRGKETFRGKPDLAKGSFYANPLHDDPLDGAESTCAQTQKNVWPDEEVPALRTAFKEMGKLIYEVAEPIVKHVDKLVESERPGVKSLLWQKTFPESRMAVGRLLHYYAHENVTDSEPTESSSEALNGTQSPWCAWHNDCSTITGLVPALWMDERSGDPAKPSSTGGLLVEARNGEQVRVCFPNEESETGLCLGFQIGEAAQILSGGVVHATPHMVKTGKNDVINVSRETFACFIQPNWDGVLEPAKFTREEASLVSPYERIFEGRAESKVIPPLRKRLDKVPVTFGDFLQGSIKEYYKKDNPNVG